MTQDEFIRTVQSRAARTCIGPSTVRGRGNAGAVDASRTFLRHLNLGLFGVGDSASFETQLNRTTNELRAALPPDCQHWGMARKILNIFLLDCFYTSLPSWPGVKYLTPPVSASFQKVAADEASEQGIARTLTGPLPVLMSRLSPGC